MNFHDIEITVYKGVRDTIGHRSTLFKFLENVEYDAIHELRSTTDANRKSRLSYRCHKLQSVGYLHLLARQKTS